MRRATTVLIAAVALLGIVAAGLVAAGCGSGSGSVPSDAVATVGDVTVTKADFQQLLNAGPDADEGAGHDRAQGGQRQLRPLRRRRS